MKHAVPIAAACLALGACDNGPIAGWEITQITDAPFEAVVSDAQIELVAGTAVALRIVLLHEDGYLIVPDEKVTFRVDGGAATVLSLENGLYFVGGSQAGTATLVGSAERYTTDANIPVIVTPQPPLGP